MIANKATFFRCCLSLGKLLEMFLFIMAFRCLPSCEASGSYNITTHHNNQQGVSSLPFTLLDTVHFVVPSATPSVTPSTVPTAVPSEVPSAAPSFAPSVTPSVTPSAVPSAVPTEAPSAVPTAAPSESPSVVPSEAPSTVPTAAPSETPSAVPLVVPSETPSAGPSAVPSETPSSVPSAVPSVTPSATPSEVPSAVPSETPSAVPTAAPSETPSAVPSAVPSEAPSAVPSAAPSEAPSDVPSAAPSLTPSAAPSAAPSVTPSAVPSAVPSETPSVTPSAAPSGTPSVIPSAVPTTVPSATPSAVPSEVPSATPSVVFSRRIGDNYNISTYYYGLYRFSYLYGLWMNSTATGNDLFMCTERYISLYDGVSPSHSVVAGSDQSGDRLVDGSYATDGYFSSAVSVVGDAGGNLFVTDYYAGEIRKIGSNGIVGTVVGRGPPGSMQSPDGGPAVPSWLDFPLGIALDNRGNVYFGGDSSRGDEFASIRKVNEEEGIIRTFVKRSFGDDTGDGGSHTSATVTKVFSLNFFNDTMFFSTAGGRIRAVDFSNGLISTVAGGGSESGSSEYSLAATSLMISANPAITVDTNGAVYIYDTYVVHKVVDGWSEIIAGQNGMRAEIGVLPEDGSATSATLTSRWSVSNTGITVDTSGNLYIALSDHMNSVSKLTLIPAPNEEPSAVPTAAPTVSQIPSLEPSASPSEAPSTTPSMSPSAVPTTTPTASPSREAGDTYNISTYYHSDSLGGVYGLWMNSTNDLFISSSYFVSHYDGENSSHTVVAGGGSGGQSVDGSPATSGSLYTAFGIVGDAGGNLYMTIPYDCRVRKVDLNGIISTVVGTGRIGMTLTDGVPATAVDLNYPVAIAMDKRGNLYFNGGHFPQYDNIRKVTAEDGIMNTFIKYSGEDSGDGGSHTSATVDNVESMYVSNNKFYFSTLGYRVRMVDLKSGLITAVAGIGSYGDATPDAVAATSLHLISNTPVTADTNGIVYIYDRIVIRKVSNGWSEIIAGKLNEGLPSGSLPKDGPATSTTISFGSQFAGITVDSSGTVFVALENSQAVAKLTLIPAPTEEPSAVPTAAPTVSQIPSLEPSESPTVLPTATPSMTPSQAPSAHPSPEAPSVVPSAVPTTAPSVTPSASPTAAPSETPSAVPSAVPSEAPSVTPSVMPSAAPSEAPTVTPSAVPSAAPSEAPSVTPSVMPSAVPAIAPSEAPSTTAPSVTPSAVPSAVTPVTRSDAPSAAPSNIMPGGPTLRPTAMPTALPTLPFVAISFDTSVFLHNVTTQQLDSASQKAVVASVAKTLEFSNWQETERRRLATGRKQVVFVAQRLVASNTATSHQIEAVVNIEASTADFADTQHDHSGAALYDKLTQLLETAVATNTFVQTVRNVSVMFNAPATQFIGHANLTVSAFSIIQPPTADTDNADSDLTDGQFAGIVVGVIMAFVLCVIVIYFWFVSVKHPESNDFDSVNIGYKQPPLPSTTGDVSVDKSVTIYEANNDEEMGI